MNAAVVLPCETVTLSGTVAAPILLDKPTVVPPDGAGPEIVTVPSTIPIPLTAVCANVTDTKSIAAAVMLRFAVCAPPKFAVIVAVPA